MPPPSASPISSLGFTTGDLQVPKQHRFSNPTSRPRFFSDDDYYDPELDVSLALAILTTFTPPPTSTTTRLSSTSEADTPFQLCTHTIVKRQRVPHEYECEGCGLKHWIGWVFKCELCQITGCHDCRGHWVERTFGALDGVVTELSRSNKKGQKLLRRESLMSVGSSGTATSTGSSGNDSVRPALAAKRMNYTPDEIDMGFELDYELVKMLL